MQKQKHKSRARGLRKNLTPAEKILWYHIRNKQMAGAHFRRQVPLENYIIDFLAYDIQLIIELDGDQHDEDDAIIYDQTRTLWLETRGYLVLRFWNHKILCELDSVIETIWQACDTRKTSLKL